jgi:hypothetical protein
MNWMYRAVLAFVLMIAPAVAADHWIEYRIGPFRIISDAGDKAARDRLDEMEQLRHVLGLMLGKDTLAIGGPTAGELKTIWPVDVVLFSTSKAYAPHALKRAFVEGGSAMLGAWPADTPLSHEMLRALTRMLIDENSGVMPDAVEVALCDLFSTIKTNGPKVSVGAPLPAGELDADRMREWAKMHMLATLPDYSGKLRVYLNNLQGGGDLGMATRNAFDMQPAKLNTLVDAYLQAGHFAPVPMSGEALDPRRDFIEKQMDQAAVDAVLAELAAAGKNFPPESPRGLLAKGTIASYELAIKANPRWGEPHFQMAQIQSVPAQKMAELKIAATLEPRNVGYWQTLAEAQTLANLYQDAAKSWTAAMKAAPTEPERARLRQVRLDLEEKRAEWEAAEKKRIAEEQARELQRIKDSAAAEVHTAEAATNKQLGEFKSNQKPVAWWDAPTGDKVAGKLTRVDCLTGGAMRLTINIDGGGTIRLLIRDPRKLSVNDVSGEAKFVCGPQRTARIIRTVYTPNADAKMNTVGDVLVVELH